MKKNNFFDFSSLGRGAFVNKKINTEGEKFLWQPVQWLQYDGDIGIIKYKHSLDIMTPFKTLNFRRRGKHTIPNELPHITDETVPISRQKKQDLLQLLPLIDDVFHEFYQNLPTTEEEAVDPDLVEENPAAD